MSPKAKIITSTDWFLSRHPFIDMWIASFPEPLSLSVSAYYYTYLEQEKSQQSSKNTPHYFHFAVTVTCVPSRSSSRCLWHGSKNHLGEVEIREMGKHRPLMKQLVCVQFFAPTFRAKSAKKWDAQSFVSRY
jgi:hypothetical protein